MFAVLAASSVIAGGCSESAPTISPALVTEEASLRRAPSSETSVLELHPVSWPRTSTVHSPIPIRVLRAPCVVGHDEDDDQVSLDPVDDPVEAGFVVATIARALDRYDPASFERMQCEIVVVSAIQIRGGGEFAGTVHRASGMVAFVSSRVAGRPSKPDELLRVVHAELSSLVLRSGLDPTLRECWPRESSKGSRISSVDAIRRGLVGRTTTPEWLARGFLYEYAATNQENDFNSIVAALACDPEGLELLAKSHAVIREKRDCALAILSCGGVRLRE